MDYYTEATMGNMLKDWLEEFNLSPAQLAREIDVDKSNLYKILKDERKINIEISMRLGRFFKVSPDYWLRMQNNYDQVELEQKLKNELDQIKPYDCLIAP